jgi:hypothetical protein
VWITLADIEILFYLSVSARATLCLANSTEVEVDTGPYFGGRISVESLNGQPGEISPASEDECK